MPRRKKRAHELTTEEAMKRLFPEEVIDRAKEIVREADRKAEKSSHKRSLPED
jgi:hypothetical protein